VAAWGCDPRQCVSYLCENPADGPDKLCAPCRASDELVLTVNAAVEKFLADRFPKRDLDNSSPIVRSDSPLRTEITEAGSHLSQGHIRLIELAVGQRVCMATGPWFDPWISRWYCSLGWDISEDQDDFKPITITTASTAP
jgi:hypothetical protein